MDAAELRVKHLEMIQAVVVRMAGQSATLKNFCITLTIGIVGFAINQHKGAFCLVAILAIAIMGALDAQYLRAERRFRALFDAVRLEDWGKQPTFEINLRDAPKMGYLATVKSWSIWQFYGPLLGGVILTMMVLRATNGSVP